jgi:diguanylate cyclase (GGDEF)-like protein
MKQTIASMRAAVGSELDDGVVNISSKEAADRKRFLEFTSNDIALLGELHNFLKENTALVEGFVQSFYEHLTSFPELTRLIPDESAIERLKGIQTRYFLQLTEGKYGAEYISDRLRVGYTHQHIGLDPKWYTGAYRKYLATLQPIIREVFKDDSRYLAANDALLKVVFFDMELALDTYFSSSVLELQRLANYDSLTKIPNRNLFHDRLRQEMKKSRRTKLPLALLLIDLDQFKEVNDTLGHGHGDTMLIETSQRIVSCVRESDTVARLGGDEFCVILPDFKGTEHIERIATNIIQKLQQSFDIGKNKVFISASIGIAIFPKDASEIEVLLKQADQAMYMAKSQGRNQFTYFTASMQEAAVEKLSLSNDLRLALERRQLTVHFQPIVELSTGRVTKAEALLRWKHPVRGMVNPSVFIPIAEESGLINEIGDWVFEESISATKRWLEQFGELIQISVNKSPVQFERCEGTGWPETLARSGLPGNSITVEITEGLLLRDHSGIKRRLIEYCNSGMEVSIDDFGTGFSALSYLKRFDIDYLKIDRSFIKELQFDENDKALTEAIIVMAHKLGIKTIAEGVETEGQLTLLRSFGCDYVQGYIYSRALPSRDFELVLRRINTGHVSD